MSGSACNAYQIRKIYAIGGALGMVKRGEDDDLLHELVNGMTGKTSIKELTYGEACKVIGELEGRQGTPPPRKSGRPLHKSVPGRTSEGQRRKQPAPARHKSAIGYAPSSKRNWALMPCPRILLPGSTTKAAISWWKF